MLISGLKGLMAHLKELRHDILSRFLQHSK